MISKNIIKSTVANFMLPLLVSYIAYKWGNNFFDKIFIVIANFLSSIDKSFTDNIYKNIGNGIEIVNYRRIEAISDFTNIFICSIFLFNFHFIKFINLLLGNGITFENENVKNRVSTVLFSFGAIILFFGIISSIQNISRYKILVYIERSLDIIAPHIDSQSQLQLKAKYRQIENYETFKSLNDDLTSLANKYNVKLPYLEPMVKK